MNPIGALTGLAVSLCLIGIAVALTVLAQERSMSDRTIVRLLVLSSVLFTAGAALFGATVESGS